MPLKLGVRTDKRPLKKVYLHPSSLQASLLERLIALGNYQGKVYLEEKDPQCGWASQSVLERRRPRLSEPKRTMGQGLKAKWTWGKQARI